MTPANDTTAQHARAVWFLDLVAKRVRTRPNGIAVVFLPSGFVDALREHHTFLCGKAHGTAAPDDPCGCDVVAHPDCCPEPECQAVAS